MQEGPTYDEKNLHQPPGQDSISIDKKVPETLPSEQFASVQLPNDGTFEGKDRYQDDNSPEAQRLAEDSEEPFEDSEGTHVAGVLAIPDGGWQAWLVVLGAVFANIATFGFTNSTGTIQQYLIGPGGTLEDYSDSQVGWIFSLMLFFIYIGGVQVGPIFDAYGLKWLIIPGSIGYVASIMILSVCTKYYQFFLGLSILGGISCSMIFNPSYTALGHWFYKRRGLVTGLTAAGGGLGGVYMPLMLDKLIPKIGFGWAVRICGFIIGFLLIITCCTLKSRLVKRKVHWREAMIDLRALKEKKFFFAVLGIFLFEVAYFVPLLYLGSYARAQGVSQAYSNALIAYLNLASAAGRCLPGYLADKWGVYNVVISTCFMTGVLCITVWLPAGTSKAGVTAFSVLFGFFSGSTIGLTAMVISTISETRHYGKRYGTTYSCASIGALIGLPIAGTLTSHNYLGLIVFSGIAYIAGSIALATSRWYAAGTKWIF